jgi:hypothetical protein
MIRETAEDLYEDASELSGGEAPAELSGDSSLPAAFTDTTVATCDYAASGRIGTGVGSSTTYPSEALAETPGTTDTVITTDPPDGKHDLDSTHPVDPGLASSDTIKVIARSTTRLSALVLNEETTETATTGKADKPERPSSSTSLPATAQVVGDSVPARQTAVNTHAESETSSSDPVIGGTPGVGDRPKPLPQANDDEAHGAGPGEACPYHTHPSPEVEPPQEAATEKGGNHEEHGDAGGSDVPAERREHMRNSGFVVVNGVSHKVMEAMSNVFVGEVRASWRPPEVAVSSTVALGLITGRVMTAVQPTLNSSDSSFKERHGIAETDFRGNASDPGSNMVFQNAFGDLRFTVPFAAGTVAAIMEESVEQGYVSPEAHAAMTATDWGDIIETPWFDEIAMDMALTKGGIYGNFGQGMGWYTHPGGLRALLESHSGKDSMRLDGPLFTFASTYDQSTDTTHLSAQVAPKLHGELRRLMKAAGSPGCVVARQSGTLSAEHAASPHVQKLADAGIMRLKPTANGRVHFSQAATPITVGLRSFANLLRKYDADYGTPQWVPGSPGMHHAQVPRVQPFTRIGNAPFVPHARP